MLQTSTRREAATVILPVSPGTTDFVYDPAATARLIRDLRWDRGTFCPRCRSTGIKKINSFFVHELFQCCGCTYTFNCTSGTIFQGSKLPLNRHLLLLMAFDFFGGSVSVKDIAGLFGVSARTARLQLDKVGPETLQNGYFDGPPARLLRLNGGASMQDLLETYPFTIHMDGFLDRLGIWLRM